jgi:DNA-binding transcriptional LysR family regulator
MPEIRVETVDLVRRIVVESDAIGIAIMSQIKDEVTHGKIVVLPLKIEWLISNYGVIRLANRTLAPAVMTFIEILREVESEIA